MGFFMLDKCPSKASFFHLPWGYCMIGDVINSIFRPDEFIYFHLPMLPPFGPNLSPFRPTNSVVFFLYIAGLSRKNIFYHTLRKKYRGQVNYFIDGFNEATIARVEGPVPRDASKSAKI
jgi:hypothetical protein